MHHVHVHTYIHMHIRIHTHIHTYTHWAVQLITICKQFDIYVMIFAPAHTKPQAKNCWWKKCFSKTPSRMYQEMWSPCLSEWLPIFVGIGSLSHLDCLLPRCIYIWPVIRIKRLHCRILQMSLLITGTSEVVRASDWDVFGRLAYRCFTGCWSGCRWSGS